jgi:glycosyltransferase involved in cell wall biosynthesis
MVDTESANHRLRILALAPNLWDSQWMNRQQLLSRLGSQHVVLYSAGPISRYRPAGVEEPRWAPRRVSRGAVKVDLLPSWMSRALRRPTLSSFLRARIAARWRSLLDREGDGPLVAWCFHPKFWSYVPLLSPDRVIYHAYDLYHRQKRWNAELAEMQQHFLARADLVVASSWPIAEYLEKQSGRDVLVVENAADFDAFAIDAADPEPADLAAVPHPRIGYAGTLNAKVDFALLAQLAARRPHWHLVLIGSVGRLDDETAAAIEQLRRLPNAHFLGFKPHTDLPRYVAAMDVNLLAYRISEDLWTEGIYPLKLHEYLAAGVPVIGADLPSLRPFADVVKIIDRTADWEPAIAAALEGRGAGTRDTRRAVARENSWEARVAELERRLNQLVATSSGPTALSTASGLSERADANPATAGSREARREDCAAADPSSAR